MSSQSNPTKSQLLRSWTLTATKEGCPARTLYLGSSQLDRHVRIFERHGYQVKVESRLGATEEER